MIYISSWLGKAIVVGGHNTELLVINRIRDEHEFVSDELSQSQRRRCGGGSRGIGGLVLGVEPAVPETGPGGRVRKQTVTHVTVLPRETSKGWRFDATQPRLLDRITRRPLGQISRLNMHSE